MLSSFFSQGYVLVRDLKTKTPTKVFVKVSMLSNYTLHVQFFPKKTMCGRYLSFYGSHYSMCIYREIDRIDSIPRIIEDACRFDEVYLLDTNLRQYTWKDHNDRILECARNLYDRETAEWLVGDQLPNEYDEVLEEEQEKLDDFVRICTLMKSINYSDCVVA